MDDAYCDHPEVPECKWKEFYPFAKDIEIPAMPIPRGKPVVITVYVNTSHAASLVIRQSHTGVLIFVNQAPIIWYSKKQNGIKTSSFGSEFMACHTAVESLKGLRYKLQMTGVSIDGYAHLTIDSMPVLKNTLTPESTRKKKSSSIAYHYYRAKASCNVFQNSSKNRKSNLSDMLTKIQSGIERR